jgi:hypothetical protein
MTAESLTYSELGERLGSSAEAALSLARRLRLVRKPGNDGRVRVIVDLAEIQYRPAPTRLPDGPRADMDALKAQIEQLQTSPNSKRKRTTSRPVWLNTGPTSSMSATAATG